MAEMERRLNGWAARWVAAENLEKLSPPPPAPAYSPHPASARGQQRALVLPVMRELQDQGGGHKLHPGSRAERSQDHSASAANDSYVGDALQDAERMAVATPLR